MEVAKIDGVYFGLNTHGDAVDPFRCLLAQDRSSIQGESVLADLHSLSLATMKHATIHGS